MTVAIEEFLQSDISQPARYLGNELGAVRKPWDEAVVRWVLTYPEVYEVGASNLGHIILYSILNRQPRQLCDRAYLPAPDLADKLRAQQMPLFGLESRQPIDAFDVVGFSLSYELGATNILEMLDLARIPLTWRERSQSSQGRSPYPLIFAGGQTATSNPEPYADFFDFIALGDGEELLPEIGLVMEEGKRANLNREALLLDLAQVPGVYVPRFYDMAADGSVHPNRPDVPDRVLRRVATPIPAYSIGLVPHVATVHDRLTVEIRRGCTRGCRFCQPGMLTRPARDVDPTEVVEAVEKGMRATGYNEFSLLSLSCSDYLSLPAVGIEIRNRLKEENISLSLPSQRVDRFDETIANVIGGTRKTGLTFAPEAGTQRLRDIINKGLTNEELLRGVKTAAEQGWDKVKLYFMIGLPGETDADVVGIAETLRWLQRECYLPKRRRLSFNVTISNFTPKPHTPFQWHSVSTAEFQRKQALLREEFRRLRGVKVNFTDVRISAMEDFLGRGDRRLAAVVRRAWELGAGMDSWWESLDKAFQAWTQAIEESDLTWKYRLIEQGEWNLFRAAAVSETVSEAVSETVSGSVPAPQNPLDAPLPWDIIDTGIDKEWLKADLQRALEAVTVPDCSYDGCSHCGVCTPEFGHNVVIPPPPVPEFQGGFQPNQQRVMRLRLRFGKLGDMALVSHLDLLRLFDRAVRRAALPVAYTGGFHPGPRISPANALALGTTSTAELVDFDLCEVVAGEDFVARLAVQLPAEMPLYGVDEVPVNAPSATQRLERAEYYLAIAPAATETPPPWQDWVDCILATDAFWYEKTTKSGKVQQVNLRDRLFDLAVMVPPLPPVMSDLPQAFPETAGYLRYVGSCRNDGTQLRPEHLLVMFERVGATEYQLLHIHRHQLFLQE